MAFSYSDLSATYSSYQAVSGSAVNLAVQSSDHPKNEWLMIYDCLPIVSVLLSEIFISRKTFLPTGRLIVGCDAPAQGKQSGFIIFSGGQFGRPDLGLVCLRLPGTVCVLCAGIRLWYVPVLVITSTNRVTWFDWRCDFKMISLKTSKIKLKV